MATLKYTDNNGKAVKIGLPIPDYYDKEESLSSEAKAALGLDKSATPSDAIAKVNDVAGGG